MGKREGITISGTRSGKKNGGIYLARSIFGPRRFFLRQSVLDTRRGIWRHRQLFDLGDDPTIFLIYPVSGGFHIREDLVRKVTSRVEGNVHLLLEKVLLPFIRKDFRDQVEMALARQLSLNRTKVTPAEREELDRELHLFDLRRLHFLWYGAVDQRRLYRMPDKLRRRLLHKSRDEKEQYFIELEQALYADQVKEYLFTVFDLQRNFPESYARALPQGLDQEKLDVLYLEDLCRLNDDRAFWRGMTRTNGLQPYLVRYLILFFDYDFAAGEALNTYIRQFMDSHRRFAFPARPGAVSLEEASAVFGESVEKLSKLSKRELKELFRRRAKQLHPDAGGDPEQFVRLKEAFEALRRKR